MSNTLIFTLDWSLAKQILICVLIYVCVKLYFLNPNDSSRTMIYCVFVCLFLHGSIVNALGRACCTNFPVIFTRDCTIIDPYPAERRLSCQYGQLTLINVVCRPYSGQISKIENNINILPFRIVQITRMTFSIKFWSKTCFELHG